MICPKCSHENEVGTQFCAQCKAPLATETVPLPAPAQSTASPLPKKVTYNTLPPRPAAESGPWILRSLPFIGAILVILAFFLPWLTLSLTGTNNGNAGATGFDLLRNGYDNFLIMKGGLPIANLMVIFLPFFALMGLILVLRGTKQGRNYARFYGIIGLVVQVFYLFFLTLEGRRMAGGDGGFTLEQVFQILGYGFYLSLGGLLWMIITPAFAPRQKR